MINVEPLEEQLIKMCVGERTDFLSKHNLIKRTMICNGTCQSMMILVNCKNYIDDAACRCYSVNYSHYRNRRSIRDGSFFGKFGKDTLKILKILIRYSGNQTRHSILQTIMISKPTLHKIMHELIALMKIENSQIRPLGGPGSVVQIDETMLNYRCKSHRGRSPTNRTDALVIAECNPM
ncbi:hypothetical protein COBT_003962, partial [Conglomerata obtusa]